MLACLLIHKHQDVRRKIMNSAPYGALFVIIYMETIERKKLDNETSYPI